MNPQQIIDELEEDCYVLARYLFALHDQIVEHYYINKYDFNQNIIRVLEKLDEKKIEEKLEYVSFYCGHIDTYKGRTSVAKVLTNWIGGEE